MSGMKWETLDVEALLNKEELPEQTTSANVGSYPVPLGPVLRRPDVAGEEEDYLKDVPDAYKEMLGLKHK
jgi:hypothetical protein